MNSPLQVCIRTPFHLIMAQILCLSITLGCEESASNAAPSESPTPTSTVTKVFHAEVASTRFEKSRGLMCRTHMADDWSMIFDMGRMDYQSFYMKNTLISLDMVFIDDRWRVVGVVPNTEPLTLDGRGVNARSRYVWELNAGVAKEWGIREGVQLEFIPPQGLPNDAYRACRSDEECTEGWTPQTNGCGTVHRCTAGRCGEPPAMTGNVTAETAQIKVLRTP